MREVERAYDDAAHITSNIKLSILEHLTSAIGDIDRIAISVADLVAQEHTFLTNDLALLCFLTPDKAERYKTARVVLEELGHDAGKDKAKDWLADKDREIREALSAEKIEIP